MFEWTRSPEYATSPSAASLGGLGRGQEVLQHPDLGLVRGALDQNLEQGHGVGELLLAVDGAAQAQAPRGVLGLEQQGVAVGGLGGLVVLLAGVGEAEETVQ